MVGRRWRRRRVPCVRWWRCSSPSPTRWCSGPSAAPWRPWSAIGRGGRGGESVRQRWRRRRVGRQVIRLLSLRVLIEAVENHMPQAIVIDKIGTKLEAMVASTIGQRGIQLIATAHGVTIENLIMNPSLEMLVGRIQEYIDHFRKKIGSTFGEIKDEYAQEQQVGGRDLEIWT